MARKYPRFLFSNPQNTKSSGPFVVHLLEPRVVFRVTRDPNEDGDASAFIEGENIGLVCLDPVRTMDDRVAIYAILNAAIEWLLGQMKSKQITL